jgi:hypothetical protein
LQRALSILSWLALAPVSAALPLDAKAEPNALRIKITERVRRRMVEQLAKRDRDWAELERYCAERLSS